MGREGNTSTEQYYLISAKTICYHYPLFMPALMPAVSSFRFIHYHCFTQRAPWPWRCECATTQDLPPRARAGRERRAAASLAGRARCNPNPNPNRAISPELYPFIYCLTILGVFYAATVGFYRCTYFRILFCTFYSRFTLLQYTYARRVIVPDNKSPVEKYCSVLVVAFGGAPVSYVGPRQKNKESHLSAATYGVVKEGVQI